MTDDPTGAARPPDEELWLDIFETLVRGGWPPDRAHDSVARGSGGGDAFADVVRARWAAGVDALREQALRGQR